MGLIGGTTAAMILVAAAWPQFFFRSEKPFDALVAWTLLLVGFGAPAWIALTLASEWLQPARRGSPCDARLLGFSSVLFLVVLSELRLLGGGRHALLFSGLALLCGIALAASVRALTRRMLRSRRSG
jgi:hypothetical protein